MPQIVGIRTLEQNASALVAAAARGDVVTITDGGRPVARMTAIAPSRLAELTASGRARPPRRPISSLRTPLPGPALSEFLAEMRDAERF